MHFFICTFRKTVPIRSGIQVCSLEVNNWQSGCDIWKVTLVSLCDKEVQQKGARTKMTQYLIMCVWNSHNALTPPTHSDTIILSASENWTGKPSANPQKVFPSRCVLTSDWQCCVEIVAGTKALHVKFRHELCLRWVMNISMYIYSILLWL